MKNYKSVLSFVLAIMMVLTTMSPLGNIAKADSEKDRFLLEVSDLKSDVKTAVASVQDIEPSNEDEKDILDKYHEAADSINRELEVSEERVSGAVGLGDSVYDLTTIPVRVQLLIRIGRAIRFATTELSNKVVAAHTKITEYILTGILYVLNPFASEGQIMEYIDRFEPLQEELLAYPDLRPEDIATIYKKAAFNRELREARRVYNSCNQITKQFRAKPLLEAIKEGQRMWWRVDVTCGELDAQLAKVHEQMEVITGPKIRVERIEFMEGEAGYIALDKKTRIRPVIFPHEVKNKDVIMYTSNPYIARVSAGEIIPEKTGSVEVICIAKDNNVKATFTLYIVEPGGYMDGMPPLQPTGNNYAFDMDPTPGDEDLPPISNDKTEVTSVDFVVDKVKVEEGNTVDVSSKTLVFPTEAINKDLTYTSENETIAVVDKYTGLVEAKRPGKVNIFAHSNNGKMGSILVEVTEKAPENDIRIVNITNSERKAGIFTVEVEATNNGNPYKGYVRFDVSNGNKTITRTVYMQNGTASVKFNGFNFGVWTKDFNAKVRIGNIVEEHNFSFK